MSKQYLVKMECKVIKHVTCEGCTEEQARESPFDHAVDEQEVSQIDWDVTDVEEV